MARELSGRNGLDVEDTAMRHGARPSGRLQTAPLAGENAVGGMMFMLRSTLAYDFEQFLFCPLIDAVARLLEKKKYVEAYEEGGFS